MGRSTNYPLLFVKGVAMGAADVVPGVSGGTIAFISGIYDELIDSIKGVNLAALATFHKQGPVACWKQINGTFLLVLLLGIFTSIFSLARLVSYLLQHHPVQVWSFFFGLILASVVYLFRQQPHWQVMQFSVFIAGVLAALFIAFSPPLAVTASPLVIFLSGMLAICAMILPGISGSFILLLIGVYPVIIKAVSELNLSVLGIFAAGAALGLIAFSRLLSWLLHRHRSITLSLLLGFLAGSLTIVWPWQRQATALSSESIGWSRELLSPRIYEGVAGNAHVSEALFLMLAGLILTLGLEYLGNRMPQHKEG